MLDAISTDEAAVEDSSELACATVAATVAAAASAAAMAAASAAALWSASSFCA